MRRAFLVFGMVLASQFWAGAALADGDNGAVRVATLNGANEVNGGDPDGTGAAEITFNHGQGMVCWQVSYANIVEPHAAHIHAAPAGVNGPVVIPLSPINGGCASADPALIKAIIQDPSAYYVNVHNAVYPGGAIRGQLSNRGQGK